jgi:hypothetical protein
MKLGSALISIPTGYDSRFGWWTSQIYVFCGFKISYGTLFTPTIKVRSSLHGGLSKLSNAQQNHVRMLCKLYRPK